LGALAACAPAARSPIDSLASLGGEEVIVVGRVELAPPLRKGEQRIRGLVQDVENKIFLIADERLRELPRGTALADFAGRIEAPIGSTFFVRSSNRPFYVLGGILFIAFSPDSGAERVYFPGGLRVAIRPGDRAVYIGTLRYERDEFFEITRTRVVDEYPAANAEFVRQFGAGQTLRKALLSQ